MSVVENHTKVGDNALVAPDVEVASSVTIGSGSFLGVGAKIDPKNTVGASALIGAGSVVARDIPSHVVVFGHPAGRVRSAIENDEAYTEEAIVTASRFLNSRMLQTGKTKGQTQKLDKPTISHEINTLENWHIHPHCLLIERFNFIWPSVLDKPRRSLNIIAKNLESICFV